MASVAHATRAHAKFSPSSSHRWINCPGSIRLSEKAPPQIESKFALEGTRAHECLEFFAKRMSSPVNQLIALAEKKWDEEMITHAIESCKEILKLKPSPNAKLLIETKSEASPDLKGTLDYAWVAEWGELVVIDYKYGAGVAVYPVDENGEENPQLMSYAAGLARKYDWEFDSVRLAIIQPRVFSPTGETTHSHKTTVKKVKDFLAKAKSAIAEAKKPDAKTCAGDWCKWCPAASFCPEISENQMRAADIFFSGDIVEATPEPTALTAERMPKLLDACDVLETWIEKVRERAFELAKSGQKIQGRKIVQKRSTRVWVEGVEAKLEKEFEFIYEPRKLISPAQLEKTYGKSAKAFTEANTATVSSGVTLVKDSDKRPEVIDALLFDV